MTDSNVSFTSDAYYLSYLPKRSYMGAVSPWFFTVSFKYWALNTCSVTILSRQHYGPDTYNKNFIYRGDDWLFSQRWEMIIANRDSVNFTEALTWNDFGESHYMGPIEGIQPMSQAWVNGFDHQGKRHLCISLCSAYRQIPGWLDLMQYYITAYKTGTYPAITRDRIFLWSRLYPMNATSPDPVPKPTNWQWVSLAKVIYPFFPGS